MLKYVLLQAATEAGKVLQQHFDKSYQIFNKEGLNNLVTEVDHLSEKVIIDIIKSNFPSHHILSEEIGAIENNSEYKWIIDPIDGTVNYAHGIPICCVSIGIEKNGEMLMGAVYNPFMNEMFFAEKGAGATLNNNTIQVSKKQQLAHSCLVTGFPYTYQDMPNGPVEVLEKLVKKGIAVRRLGSAAIDLCWVACGRFDGFYEHKLNAWDSAAGYLIVQEAGGTVTNMKGETYSPYQPYIVATNGIIHQHLLNVINGGEV